MKENEKPNRGGSRPGAGRPSTNKKMKSFRFAPDVLAVVEAQKDQTAYLEEAVRFYEDRRP